MSIDVHPSQLTPTAYNAVRISKRSARKLYNADVPLIMVACKLWPFGGWAAPSYRVQKSDLTTRATFTDHADFDAITNNYTFYNCTYETGYYPAYYASEHAALAHNVTPLSLER